jgi:tetratricopeptide (TPR) repeat protein
VERARDVQPEFQAKAENLQAVAEVCRHLDGLPLAIELAAARVKALPVETINERLAGALGAPFRLLTGGSRTGPPRQHTLRALIDWSYDLLTEPERTLLRRLAVFAGGWTLEAAEAVAGDAGTWGHGDAGNVAASPPLRVPASLDVLDLLTSLVEKSLVIYEQQEERYRLLETVRHYAAERLLESGEGEAVRGRHLECFLRLMEEGEPQLRGPEQAAWLTRLEAENANLRAALDWCQEKETHSEALCRLTGALWWFWVKRGYLGEARQRLETALRTVRSAPPHHWGKLLDAAATVAYFQGDYASSRSFCERRLAFSREAGDVWGVAWALFLLGMLASEDQDHEQAIRCAQESRAAARTIGDGWLTACALLVPGYVARDRGDFEESARWFSESLALYRVAGDLWGQASCLNNLGTLRLCQGLHQEAMALCREGLILCQESADRCGVGWLVQVLAGASAAEGMFERAARLMGMADGTLESTGGSLPPLWRDIADRAAAACRAALGEEAFAAAWAEGRAMTLEQAIAYALEEAPASKVAG